MSQFNPLNVATWPLYQAWEKASSRVMDTMVRDPFMLDMSARMLSGMLQSKKMVDRMFGIDPTGKDVPASNVDVIALQQRLVDLERRVATLEQGKRTQEADA